MTGWGDVTECDPSGRKAPKALTELLDSYGADPTRWPDGDSRRAAAWVLVQSNDPDAARLTADAAAVDCALNILDAPTPSAALTGAILQAAQRPVRAGFSDWAARFWTPVAALACAGFLGIMVGIYSPVPVAPVAGQMASLETEVASLGSLDGADFGELSE